MKQFQFFWVLFFFTHNIVAAQNVSESTARTIAKNFINLQSHQKKAVDLVNITPSINSTYDGFYVFKNTLGNGFYIISSEHENHPVLGYSNDSSLPPPDEISPEFLYILDWYQNINEQIRKNRSKEKNSNNETKNQIQKEWNILSSEEGNYPSPTAKSTGISSISPLINTRWNQNPYYNKYTPLSYEGGETYTGCVSTTMAQIMKFWNYPATGNGTKTYTIPNTNYNWKGKTLTANFGNTTYNWADMPDILTSSSHPTQIDAIATLMLHTGIAVSMEYGPLGSSGSGAPNEYVAGALKNYFKYSPDAEIKYRSSYNDTDWLNLIKDQISKGYPVYFSGFKQTGSGHAFVADGYNEDYIHFNFGWGGNSDGYYLITFPIGYTEKQSVVINIHPISENANCTTSAPTGLTSSSITNNKATLSWNPVNGAQSYTVEYKQSSASTWIVAASSTIYPFLTLSELTANTTYDWRVKVNCSGTSSPYVQANFSTINASPCVYNYEPNETLDTAYPINTNISYSAGIDSGSDKDYYKFTLTTPSNIIITLKNLPKDYDFKLYNSTGVQIGVGNFGGTNNEMLIMHSLSADTYYVQVYGSSKTDYDLSKCYDLKIATTTVCYPPALPTASNVSSNGATLSWTGRNGTPSYTVEYKTNSDTDWIVATPNNTTSSFNLSGLAANTVYNWRVKANCFEDNSSSYTTGNFTTLTSTCDIPAKLTTTNISGNGATLSWNAVSGAQSYTIEYKLSSVSTWTVAASNSTTTSLTISGLTPNSSYNWRIKTNYANSNCPDYASSNFTTLSSVSDCKAPTELTAPSIRNNGVTLSWKKVSGALSYTVEYKTESNPTWSILSSGTTANTLIINGLRENTAYNFRIRTNCPDSGSSGYTLINFSTLATICNVPPSGLTINNITTNSAILSWTAVSGAQSYTLEYKPASASIWNVISPSTTITSHTLTGLTPGTAYEWRVKNNCSDLSNSDYATASFYTTVDVCNAPSGLITLPDNYGASLSWNPVSGANSYTIEYKLESNPNWTYLITTVGTSNSIRGLNSNQTYNWRVKSNCPPNISSDYSQENFSTKSCISNYEANETMATAYQIKTKTTYNAGINSPTDTDYYKFTLETASNIIVTLQNLPKNYNLRLYNSSGIQIGSSENVGTTNESITLNNLASGTYYILVYGYDRSYDLSQCYSLRVDDTVLCSPPLLINTSNITSNSAKLGWTGRNEALSHTIEYKSLSSSSWTKLAEATTTSSFDLSGLTANTDYNWRIKSNCPAYNTSSIYSQANFSTLPTTVNKNLDTDSTLKQTSFSTITLYPNPVSDIINIKGLNSDSMEYIQIIIFDLNGGIIRTSKVKIEDVTKINVSDLPPNTYYLNIIDKNFKFIKI